VSLCISKNIETVDKKDEVYTAQMAKMVIDSTAKMDEGTNQVMTKYIQKVQTSFDSKDNNDDNDGLVMDSGNRIYDITYNFGRSKAIIILTDFTCSEFDMLFHKLEDGILTCYNVGRGHCSPCTAKDSLLMLLTVLKRGETWGVMALYFKIATSTFARQMDKMLDIVANVAYKCFVQNALKRFTMKALVYIGYTFSAYLYAHYATEVRFHHSYWQSATMKEALPYFSGKHWLHGLKTEASVLPNGLAIYVLPYQKGAVCDVVILHETMKQHHEMTLKMDVDSAMADTGELHKEYPQRWAVLADKGYVGAAEPLQVVHPSKTRRNHPPDKLVTEANSTISSNRIIVENWFGRLTTLWGLMAKKYCWDLDKYNKFV
jgi:DDE superfamily endonuclease